MPLKTALLTAWLAASSVAAGAQPAAPIVTIDSGKLAGNEKDGVMSFLGIPYAAPPTGDLRWQAPQPAKAWQDTRQATEFGPVCRQTAEWVKLPQSEDCLTLNVWAPVGKAGRPYPVLVWIHGGGLNSGHGSEWGPEGGRSIVQKGVILVSINYRLGMFGFFAHPELSADAPDHAAGNQGFRDQIAALHWVQRNIAAFGGDPHNVTIAGESAGASSVSALTVSPLASGLFQRGIAESGVTGPLPPAATAENLGRALGEALKAPHLGDLRKLGADDLLKQKWQVMPYLDGAVFTEQPQQSFAAGHQNKVPLLLGWNADEGVDLAPDLFGTKDITAANYESLLQKPFGPQPPSFVLTLYPGKTDAEVEGIGATPGHRYDRTVAFRLGHHAAENQDPAGLSLFLHPFARGAAGGSALQLWLQGRTYGGNPLRLWPVVARVPRMDQGGSGPAGTDARLLDQFRQNR